jgi:DNA topoisomerase 2-associated protein PAT1
MCYLQLITQGSQIALAVCMAVFRHLRFLFNGPQSDVSSTATSAGLANAVALVVMSMDLPSLSACLLTVVSVAEPTPLHPMGSPSGDGATLILRLVLERASTVQKDRGSFYILQTLNVWQHAFDTFFALLTRYCTNKYESVIHSLMMSYPGNIPVINAAADEASKKEIPVELLQVTLRDTSEQQRKLLYDFITKGAGPMSWLSSSASIGSRIGSTTTVQG